ncbi:unnamed protein product, partial [Phaeothamnion confervicola]
LNFFGTAVAPVLYIRVNVDAAAATANISIESVELEGSEAVRSIRGAYNEIGQPTASFIPAATPPMRLQVTLRVDLLVPRESWLPPTALEKGGSFVLQRVLDIGVPQFLRFLRRDYERWSAGDDSRAPVA